ncbi:hypothetical protein LguiA_027096 [Lonicera macranthoides]
MEEGKRSEESGKNTKDEEEEYLYLYIVLRQQLCRINLTQLLLEEEEEEERSKPPFEILLYFPEKALPVGMGAFAYNSNLYLLGGEVLKKGERLHDFPLSDPRLFKRLSKHIFLYDRHHHHHPRRILQHISSMTTPKPCPQVAIVDGKVYVFSGQHHCYKGEVCFPFECYDPTENSWEALPDPHFYCDWPIFNLYVYVLGRQIFVMSHYDVYTYHVDDCTWTGSGRVEEDSPFRFRGRVVAQSDDDGIVVGYASRGLVAYKDATLGRAQVLQELNKAFPSPSWSKQAAFVNYLGDKRYCLLLSEPFGRVTGFLEIHVLLFRVEMLQQEEEEEEADTHEGEVAKDFCSVSLLRHKIYNATDITSEMLNPTNVFTMREGSNKQGVDCLGVFQMGKDRSNRASSADEGNGGGGEVKGLPQLSQTLQESERFLSQAGRPGGTLKVPIQTSADYVPQDEDAVQQSKEALAAGVAPRHRVIRPGTMQGATTALRFVSRGTTESFMEKWNEVKLENGRLIFNLSVNKGKDLKNEVSSSAEDVNEAKKPVVDESVESQTNKYSISANPTEVVKRIRTLQKKIQIIMRKSGLNKEHQVRLDALFREMKFLELQKKSSNCKASPLSSR